MATMPQSSFALRNFSGYLFFVICGIILYESFDSAFSTAGKWKLALKGVLKHFFK